MKSLEREDVFVIFIKEGELIVEWETIYDSILNKFWLMKIIEMNEFPKSCENTKKQMIWRLYKEF